MHVHVCTNTHMRERERGGRDHPQGIMSLTCHGNVCMYEKFVDGCCLGQSVIE